MKVGGQETLENHQTAIRLDNGAALIHRLSAEEKLSSAATIKDFKLN